MPSFTLPADGYIPDAARTNAEEKSAFEAFRDFVEQLVGAAGWQSATISSNAINVRYSHYIVDGPSGANNLDRLGVDASDGSIVVLRILSNSRTVTFRHAQGGTGPLYLNGGVAFACTDTAGWIMFQRTGSTWYERMRSYGVNASALSNWRAAFGIASVDSPTLTTLHISPKELLTDATEPDLSSADGALLIGASWSPSGSDTNLTISRTAIQARAGSSSYSDLDLQPLGGNVRIGASHGIAFHTDNDGSGSTLDADLLDGEHGTAVKNPGYILLRREYDAGANGGNSDVGWNNIAGWTLVQTDVAGVTYTLYLALPAGTYICHLRNTMYGAGLHKLRLSATSESPSTKLVGTAGSLSADAQGDSVAHGIFTLSATRACYVHHYVTSAVANYGRGRAVNDGAEKEVYGIWELWKIA